MRVWQIYPLKPLEISIRGQKTPAVERYAGQSLRIWSTSTRLVATDGCSHRHHLLVFIKFTDHSFKTTQAVDTYCQIQIVSVHFHDITCLMCSVKLLTSHNLHYINYTPVTYPSRHTYVARVSLKSTNTCESVTLLFRSYITFLSGSFTLYVLLLFCLNFHSFTLE